MENQLQKVYECEVCGSKYDKRDSYRWHMREKHKHTFAEKKIECCQEKCREKFSTMAAYREHLANSHGFANNTRIELFKTEGEFANWKKEHEQKSVERYVKNTGDKVSMKGRCLIFDCNRSGFEKTKPFTNRNKMDTIQGSQRINGRCPAQMVLVHKENGFELTFYNVHTHEIVNKYVHLCEKTCETIAGFLKAGFTEEYILDYYKTMPVDHRDRWVTKEDLTKIAERFNISNEWRAHSEDCKSVHLFVEENRDKVIFYQPELKVGECVVQEFILVLMTDRQLNYINSRKKFPVICADSTHNVGAKKKMATKMTVNEDEEGVALAFCFCNSESTSTMQIFFSAIRNKLGFCIETDYFVSDDANAFFNACCAEIKTDKLPHKRLCAWHVNKNWTAHLSKVPKDPVVPEQLNRLGKPITKRDVCKFQLFSMRSELDKEELKIKVEKFLKLLNVRIFDS